MKIRLVDYKEGVPAEVNEDYDPKKLDIEFVDLQYIKPLHMDGVIEKGIDTLSFRGNLSSEAERVCGRCLKRVKTQIQETFELFYETTGKEYIETIDDLREALILDHPISYVCQENCLGLCPQCGVNRNETRCNCNAQMSSQPLGQLKKLWLKGREE